MGAAWQYQFDWTGEADRFGGQTPSHTLVRLASFHRMKQKCVWNARESRCLRFTLSGGHETFR